MVRTSAVIWVTIAFSIASTLAVPLAVPQWDSNGLARRSGEVVPRGVGGGLRASVVQLRPGVPTPTDQPVEPRPRPQPGWPEPPSGAAPAA